MLYDTAPGHVTPIAESVYSYAYGTTVMMEVADSVQTPINSKWDIDTITTFGRFYPNGTLDPQWYPISWAVNVYDNDNQQFLPKTLIYTENFLHNSVFTDKQNDQGPVFPLSGKLTLKPAATNYNRKRIIFVH